MQPTKELKLLTAFVVIGLITCILLLIVDLKIKDDLIRAAMKLEVQIDDGIRAVAQFDHTDSSIPDSVPVDPVVYENFIMEAGIPENAVPVETEVPPPSPNGRAGNRGKRIHQDGGPVQP